MANSTDDDRNCLKRLQPRRLLPVERQESVIISIAAGLFLERGFKGVTIDAITSIAGGSKRDIYGLFGDKEALFERCVTALVTERAASLGNIAPSGDIRACMISVGLRIVDLFIEPRTLALHRLIVSDQDKAQSASMSFLVGGPQRAYDAVASLLDHYQSAGDIALDNTGASARIFVGGLTSELQIRSLMGETIGDTERHSRVEMTVDHFLRGVLVFTR